MEDQKIDSHMPDRCSCFSTTATKFNKSLLLHSFAHRVESSSWDGRLALVIASDMSVYEPGSAQATGEAALCLAWP